MSAPLQVIQSAIGKLFQGDVQSATSSFFEVSKDSGKHILQSILGEKEYWTAKEMTYVLQSAALYYFARAFEQKQKSDNVAFLAYLSYASGINAVLDTIMMPMIRRYAIQYNSQKEIDALEMMQSDVEQKIAELTQQVISVLRGKGKEESVKQVDESIRKMVFLARTLSPDIRELSVRLGKIYPAGDFKQARRVYEFVRDEIKYIRDPLGVEEIQSPQRTIELGSGDCDDKALLLASLLMAIGFETCLFVADVDSDGLPDHVYTGVYIPEAPEYCKPFPNRLLFDAKNYHDWIPLDPTYEDSEFGLIPLIDLGILKYVPIPSIGEDG